ncbi:MAG TPA: aspartyl protease family protein [Rhizomicrobium sp.]|nr:aspartyl protease family protein [Rhizomicrobium sp.]
MASELSRRGLLGTALSLAALRAARADDIPTQTPSNAMNILTIPVAANGKGPFHFVVDSGAERTVLADDVAAALGLAKTGRASVVGVARALPADTVRLSSLSVGNTTVNDLDLPVLPRALMQADGYLGLDVIDGHRITFNFTHGQLELNDPIPTYFSGYARPDEDVLSADGRKGKLRTTDCRIDGINATAFLDTGADVSVGNMQLYRMLADEGDRLVPAAEIMLAGITGGRVPAQALSIGRIRLGNLDFNSASLAIADLPVFDLWGLKEKPAIFVGMDFLRHFSRVTIDYGRKQYRLQFAALRLASRTKG